MSPSFNELIDAAPVQEIDLDSVPIDTIFLKPSEMLCDLVDPASENGGPLLLGYVAVGGGGRLFMPHWEKGIYMIDWHTGQAELRYPVGKAPGEMLPSTLPTISAQDPYIILEDPSFIHFYDSTLHHLRSVFNVGAYAQWPNTYLADSLLITTLNPTRPGTRLNAYLVDDIYTKGSQAIPRRSFFEEVFPPTAPQRIYNNLYFHGNNGRLVSKYMGSPFLFVTDLAGDVVATIRIYSHLIPNAIPHDPEEPYTDTPGKPLKYHDPIRYNMRLHPDRDVSLNVDGTYYHMESLDGKYTAKKAMAFMDTLTLGGPVRPNLVFVTDFDRNFLYFTHIGTVSECLYRVAMDW